MNAFSVLLDDVEDAADLTAAPPLRHDNDADAVVEADPSVPSKNSRDSAPGRAGRGRGGASRGGMGGGRGGGRGRGRGGFRRGENDDRNRQSESTTSAPPKPEQDTAAETEEKDPENDAAANGEDAAEATTPPEEKVMSLDEYNKKKAELAASVASLSVKGTRKANEGRDGDAFGKMARLKKGEDLDESQDADASSILSSVVIKEPPAAKGRKDTTQAAVLDNAKIQSFFKNTPGPRSGRDGGGADRRDYGGGRGSGRGGGRGGGVMDSGQGRGGSSDARNSNYSGGRQGGSRDFRNDNRFNRDGEGGGGRGRGGYHRRGGHAGFNNQSNNNRGQAPVSAPSMDDTNAFPSLA